MQTVREDGSPIPLDEAGNPIPDNSNSSAADRFMWGEGDVTVIDMATGEPLVMSETQSTPQPTPEIPTEQSNVEPITKPRIKPGIFVHTHKTIRVR